MKRLKTSKAHQRLGQSGAQTRSFPADKKKSHLKLTFTALKFLLLNTKVSHLTSIPITYSNNAMSFF